MHKINYFLKLFYFLIGFILISCGKEESNTKADASGSQQVSTRSIKCKDYCDGCSDAEINVIAISKHPTRGCCYTIRYNGVGGWTNWLPPGYTTIPEPETCPFFESFEGKQIEIMNHECEGDALFKRYFGWIHNGEAIICTGTNDPFPYPQITLHIYWFQQFPNVGNPPVILGCKGYHIGWPGEFPIDPWRDPCN